jgi:two-component system, chemotaxis family, sensor kinase CheA
LELNEYKEVFLTEAREYLSTLNNALVALERDPTQIEAIREIFRAAHTLKGMSATMGYEPMARLTHQMETVLEPVRSGAKTLPPLLVDALFNCLDRLEKWVGILSSQDSIEEGDLQATLQSLEEVSKSSNDPVTENVGIAEEKALTLTSAENEILSQARMNGFSVFAVTVELAKDCAFKEVRAFMILKNVNDIGEIVKAHPSPEDIEKGRFARSFSMVIVTDGTEEKLRQSLLSVSEVTQVQVWPFREEEASAHEGEDSHGAPSGSKGSVERVSEVSSASSGSGQAGSMAAEERAFVLPTIRVHTSKLDKLMALVQELVISKIRFEQVASNKELTELTDPLSQLNHITDELQNEIMKVRLMSVKQIFERFPRMVRDLARSLQKQVNLEMEGAEVELDRTVLEEMSEPLVHLLRNAVDHGIETPDIRVNEGKEAFGTIRLQAKRERSYVVIYVTDDGRGIDPDVVRQRSVAKGLISSEEVVKLTDEEAIRLIALPGFSTVESATEISGRGVGVDVAKTKVESIGGTFRIQSRKGQGTTFILKFPLTLAIIKALLVRCGSEIFAIPVVNIIETVDVLPEEKKRIQQQETITLRDEVIPVYELQELLELEGVSPSVSSALETVLIAEVGDSRVGIRVDEIIGQQEIAIKSLDRLLKAIRGFSGATILGSGKIALILDVNSLIEDLKDKRFQAEHPLFEKDSSHVAQSR